ncbi:hypothetical protein [Pantoea ananatis]|uniref:hypothetical protein n=1 Tax=Pantoea ananas TaxID=553 RepID=UPI00188EFC3E|nr:hypothetical protein [Pantoea ananatis]
MDLSSVFIGVAKVLSPFIYSFFSLRNFFSLNPSKKAEAISWLFKEPPSRNPLINYHQSLKLRSYGFVDDMLISRKVVMLYIHDKTNIKYCKSFFSMRGAYIIKDGVVIPKQEKTSTLLALSLVWICSSMIFIFSFMRGLDSNFSYEIKLAMIASLFIFLFYSLLFYIYITSHKRIKKLSSLLSTIDDDSVFHFAWVRYFRGRM